MRKFTALLVCALAVNLLVAQVNAPQTTELKIGSSYFTMPNLAPDEYLPNTIILKVKDQYRANCQQFGITGLDKLTGFFSMVGTETCEKMFPNHQKPAKQYNELGQKLADLSLIYTMKFNGGFGLEKVINKLFALGYFEFVEPYYIPKAEFTPNDPQQGSQYHLTRIDAYLGWNTQQGSSNVVIGITDTGIELTHNDLSGQIKYNTADGPAVNGIDDDLDGFIDNYYGWDVGMNDRDPSWQANNHGVHVSGCAAAHTNNNTMIAAPGFNCKLLPVKISDASGTLIAAYQGITYAADHGADIINCSWGGGGGGAFGQTIIDYATINMGALVIAACGNNSSDEAFYPAAYNYVISIASTGATDIKSGFSNYNYTVDVCAPGSSILSTINGNTTGQMSGTSMASPVAAGVAGIIKSQYPTYTGLQVGAMLKATAKSSILSLSGNLAYANKLGTGLVNMNNGVTMPTAKYIEFANRFITDNNDDVFMIGDVLSISGDFINYLAPTTSACTATLTSLSGNCTVINGSFPIGVLATLAQTNNTTTPFTAQINTGTPINAVIPFRVAITDGSSTTNHYFSVIVNVDYINVTMNDVWTTITSKGRIGYNQDGQQQGLGFKYMIPDSAMMYESSMMIGNSSTRVSDMFRGTAATGDVDNSTLVRVYQVTPTVFSDFDLSGQFRDNLAPSPIGITTRHNAYAWMSIGNRKYVIVEYWLKNTGTSTVSNLWCGVISDWDVTDVTYGNNKANQDASRKMGYVYNTIGGGYYAGIKVLTQTPFNHYGIDNVGGGGGGVDPTAGTPEFSTSEKFTVLSTSRPTAGNTQTNGNDVMSCVSSGPFTVNVGDSVKVAFALLAGDNLADLQTSADNAQVMYDGLTGMSSESLNEYGFDVYPNPTNGLSYLQFFLDEAATVDIRLFDALGNEVATVASGEMGAGKQDLWADLSRLSSGMYYYQITVNGKTISKKIIVTNE
ncbi:MAG: S8/S53 family peptidase [Bacteroidota bacterium]